MLLCTIGLKDYVTLEPFLDEIESIILLDPLVVVSKGFFEPDRLFPDIVVLQIPRGFAPDNSRDSSRCAV